MKKVVLLFISTSLVIACQKNEEINMSSESVLSVPTDMLQFSNANELQTCIEEINDEKFITTKAGNDLSEGFLSLKDYLTEVQLSNLTKQEVETYEKDGLIFEPEDSLIVDMGLMSVLNKDREVKIGQNIYKYIPEGLIVYPATIENGYDSSWVKSIDTQSLGEGESVFISNDITFTKIVYKKWANAPVTRASGTASSIELNDGLVIPASNVVAEIYDNHTGLFGVNVTVDNYFDNKHRMKLRLFDQNYVVYRSVGMTVRMQQKEAGIWWRKSADEFRYGWTALECVNSFNSCPFDITPNGTVLFPECIVKTIIGNNNNVLFYHLPYSMFNTSSSNVDYVYSQGMNSAYVRDLKERVSQYSGFAPYANNPEGFYTTTNNNTDVILLYPQGEETSYDDGRELVRWDFQFTLNLVLMFESYLDGVAQSLSISDVNISGYDVTINRGRVYAAVKYNGVWRGCEIKTQ